MYRSYEKLKILIFSAISGFAKGFTFLIFFYFFLYINYNQILIKIKIILFYLNVLYLDIKKIKVNKYFLIIISFTKNNISKHKFFF